MSVVSHSDDDLRSQVDPADGPGRRVLRASCSSWQIQTPSRTGQYGALASFRTPDVSVAKFVREGIFRPHQLYRRARVVRVAVENDWKKTIKLSTRSTVFVRQRLSVVFECVCLCVCACACACARARARARARACVWILFCYYCSNVIFRILPGAV